MTAASAAPFRRVEHHMSTAISLAGVGIADRLADAFFDRIRHLEDVLSRFRDGSDLSRLARGELGLDGVDPAVRIVVARCEVLRRTTRGDFDHEPGRSVGDEATPVLDVDALAKGWIIEDAATLLRMEATEFLVNAGGDVLASARVGGRRWRVGIQHPTEPSAILGTFGVVAGAVATSGTYERGAHIRLAPGAVLTSVTVVGPDLGTADALSTAVFSSGQSPPAWWSDVDPTYGLLTVSADARLRWLPPGRGAAFDWQTPLPTATAVSAE